MIRTRSRTEYLDQAPEVIRAYKNSSKSFNPAPPPYLDFSLQLPPFGVQLFEKTLDDSSSKRNNWNPIEHYRVRMDPAESKVKFMYLTTSYNNYYVGYIHPILSYWNSRVPPPYGQIGEHNLNLPTMYVPRADGGFVPPPDNLVFLQNRALSTILPKIKAELSLINSIIELKDFRSWGRILLRARDLVRSGQVLNSVRSTLRRATGMSFRRASSSAAVKANEAFLQTSFAILPLLSDISGIYAALSKVERRINDLVTREGKKQLRHCSFNTTLADVDEAFGTGYLLNAGQFAGSAKKHLNSLKCQRHVRYGTTTFHVQVEYNYNFTQYQREHARMLALLDYFGVNLNPSIIWNALPWTFVIDWLVNIGSWLDQFKNAGNMEPRINIHRCLWSIKGTRKAWITTKSYNTPLPGQPPNGETKLPDMYESAYRREVFTPSISSIQTSGLSPKEFSLSAALVIAQRRRVLNRLRPFVSRRLTSGRLLSPF